MTWKYVNASSAGMAHIFKAETCQDECFVKVFALHNSQEILLCLAADGAGSSVYGGKGAEIACKEAQCLIENWIVNSNASNPTKELVVGWVTAIQKRIYEVAENENLSSRDYACTLLCSIVAHNSAIFFQVGDGAIIIRKDKQLVPVFWPENGEYANTTYFITDDNSLSHLMVKITDVPPNELAMLTDGLQRLSLVYETKSVHEPFFEPMFSVLRQADEDTCVELNDQLLVFLNSRRINDRTDDDKTLILATQGKPVDIESQ